MFDTEIQGLRKLIANAQEYCRKRGYDAAATDAFIDQRCRLYADIFVPIVATKPEIYPLLVDERPSLGLYLVEQINQYLASLPTAQEIEHETVKILADMQKHHFTRSATFDMGEIASVQVLLHKYGFSQGLLSAIHKVKPELFSVVMNLYDMRLKAAQTIDEPINHPRDR